MYNSGDKPGKGSYKCINCGTIVVIENDDDALPICPVCHHTIFEKVK